MSNPSNILENSGRPALVLLILIAASTLTGPVQANDLDKTEVVRVQFGERFYDIPTNYGAIKSGGIDTPRGGKALMFTVQMPDLAPRTAKNDEQFRRVGWHDQVGGLFDFIPGRKSLVGKEVLAIDLKDSFIDKAKFDTTPNGFRVYTPRIKIDPDIRTKVLANGDVFVMRCYQPGQKYLIYPSCTVLESWQQFMLTFSFSIKYAEQADVIDQKVKAMMLSFQEK